MKYDLFFIKNLNTTMISFDERQNPLGLNVVSLVVIMIFYQHYENKGIITCKLCPLWFPACVGSKPPNPAGTDALRLYISGGPSEPSMTSCCWTAIINNK